jgi:exosortase
LHRFGKLILFTGMEHLSRQLHRWWIPLASGVVFFAFVAFVLPYGTSQWDEQRSIASLIFAMSCWGQGPIDMSYCLFVPPIVIYLVYNCTPTLIKTSVKSSNFGLALIVAGLLPYWFGLRADNQYFGFMGVQILLAGVILWLWGWAVFRVLLFPWAFLIFAWPMPFLDPIIAFPLRMDMSVMAGHLLPMLGIPCIQNGTALISPPDVLNNIPMGSRFQIDIADPCSGIRSLFALLMFSALFGYLFLPRLWQQWAIFLSAFPLAIVGNLARVVMLVLGSIWFGSTFAIGTIEQPSWFHEACGFLVYGVALGAEIALASLLTRKWNRPDEFSEVEHVAA